MGPGKAAAARPLRGDVGPGSRGKQRSGRAGSGQRRRIPRPGSAAASPEAARGRARGAGAGGRTGKGGREGLPLGFRHHAAAARAPQRAGESPAQAWGKVALRPSPPPRPPGLGAGAGSRPHRGGRGSHPPRSSGRPRLPGEGAPPPAARQEPGRGVPLTRTPAREDGPGASAAGKEAETAAGASSAGPPRLRVCGGGLLPAPAPGRPRRRRGPAQRGPAGGQLSRPTDRRGHLPVAAPPRPGPTPTLAGPLLCGAGLGRASLEGKPAKRPRLCPPGWVLRWKERSAISRAP